VKGLANILSAVLIVVIGVLAVAIAWSFIFTIVNRAGEGSTNIFEDLASSLRGTSRAVIELKNKPADSSVNLVVKGISCQDGQQVELKYYEVDTLSENDILVSSEWHLPEVLLFSNGQARGTWISECIPEGETNEDDENPEIMFIATCGASSVTSDIFEITGCETIPSCAEGEQCDDGNLCTETDKCTASGDCAGTAKTCLEGRQCNLDNGNCEFISASETNCANGFDDDGDGNIDCADSDCDTIACTTITGTTGRCDISISNSCYYTGTVKAVDIFDGEVTLTANEDIIPIPVASGGEPNCYIKFVQIPVSEDSPLGRKFEVLSAGDDFSGEGDKLYFLNSGNIGNAKAGDIFIACV